MKAELYCRTYKQWMLDPSLCLYEWQTLLTCVFIVLAAVVTYFAAKHQTRTQLKSEEEKRLSRLRSKKSVLCISLNDAINDCVKSAKALDRWKYNFNNFEENYEIENIKLDKKYFNVISSIIQSEKNEEITELLSYLIYKIMSYNNSLDKFKGYLLLKMPSEASFEINELAECLGTIYAISTKLFSYSYGREIRNTSHPEIWEICALFDEHDLKNVEIKEHLETLEKITEHLRTAQ